MACSINIKTTNFLKEEGVIDGDNNILNSTLANDYIKDLNILAQYKYGVGNKDESIYKIVDNKLVADDRLFELLEEAVFTADLEKIFTSKISLKDIFQEEETDVFQEIEELEAEQLDSYKNMKVDLTNLENRIEYTLDRVQQSIRQNIIRLTKIVNNPKVNEVVKSYSQDKLDTLRTLISELEEQKNGITAKGITSFVNNMNTALRSIDNALLKLDLDNPNQAKFLLENYDNYLSTFSVANDIQELISEFQKNETQKYLTEKELNELSMKLNSAVGNFEGTVKNIIKIKKDYFRNQLNDIKYFPGVLNKHRNKLANEFTRMKYKGDKAAYINKHLAPGGKNWAEIQKDVKDAVDNILDNPIFDVKSADNWFTSPSNISNDLFQIFHRMLIEIDNQRLAIDRTEDAEAAKIFNDLRIEKNSLNPNVLYKNITQKDKNGRLWLLGEYHPNFIIEVTNKVRDIKNKARKIIDEKTAKAIEIGAEYGYHSGQYLQAQKEVEVEVERMEIDINKILDANTIKKDDDSRVPNSKWRNNISNLSTAEKAALNYYKGVVDKGHRANYNESLRTHSYGGLFYNTPFISKSSLERFFEGDIKGSVTEKWNYLNETRADDIEYTNQQVDLAGEAHRELRLHYRDTGNKFEDKNQSMDLATMFRLENKNVNLYSLRREKEADFSFLIDIAKNQKFYTKNGNYFQRNFGKTKLNITSNVNNNLAQNLKNMMDYRFYDISNKTNQKWGPLDANKATNYINGATAFMALSFNFASGTANVVNANAQMFLETVFKGHTFTAKNIAKAQRIYFTPSVFNDTLKDNVRPINTGYVNQLSEIFNTRGLYSLSDSNFLQANLAKKGLDLKALQVFQDSGEHWIQSILMMSVLDNIKVMNKNSDFIDKDGKVVKKFSDAASLLDMHKVNPKTGLVTMDSNVVFTTHSPSTEYNKGGKELIDILIRKKIDDNIGNYTQTQQAEGYRHYLFKIGMLFRKYLVPMGQARLLGIESSYVAKDKLREDQTRFSHALQQYEEGTYTTLIRYAYNSLKTFKKELLTRENWDNLSDYEKHNIKRALTELAMTFVILPNSIKLMAMGAASDDDRKQEWYFLMYQTRRNITELQAYINPMETFKMLKSPIPSVRFLENTISVLKQSWPAYWFEEDREGNNIWLKNVNGFNPLRQFSKDFERTFQYQNNNFSLK